MNFIDYTLARLKSPKNDEECPLNKSEVTSILTMITSWDSRFKRIEKLLFCLFVVITAIGCGRLFEDNTHVKDLSNQAIERIKILNKQYCAEENTEFRKLLIAVIRLELPYYPKDGLCNLEQSLENFIDKKGY